VSLWSVLLVFPDKDCEDFHDIGCTVLHVVAFYCVIVLSLFFILFSVLCFQILVFLGCRRRGASQDSRAWLPNAMGLMPLPDSVRAQILSRLPETKEPPEDHCAICMAINEADTWRLLPCGHKFHPQCVDPWLRDHRGVCPLCRADPTLPVSPPTLVQPPADISSSPETLEMSIPPIPAASVRTPLSNGDEPVLTVIGLSPAQLDLSLQTPASPGLERTPASPAHSSPWASPQRSPLEGSARELCSPPSTVHADDSLEVEIPQDILNREDETGPNVGPPRTP